MSAGTLTTLTELLVALSEVDSVTGKTMLDSLMNDPAAQFGTGELPYLGKRLMPERLVDANMFKEVQIKYRSFLANSGSYYSPAQMSATGELIGEFNVELGKKDIAAQVTAQDYDNFKKLLKQDAPKETIMAALRWFDNNLLRPHLDLDEKEIFDVMLNAQLVRTGSNGYSETVTYPNPSGHRPAAISGGTTGSPTGWYDMTGSYDPFEDIFAMVDLLDKKGYRVNRIITGGRKLLSVLGKNPTVKERTSRITVSTAGQIEAMPGRATSAQINAYLAEEGVPPIEIYRKTYHTRANGEQLFMPDDKLLFVCTTGITQPVDLGSRGVLEMEDTLGYYAIGVPAGTYTPGRVTNVEERKLYPTGFYGEAVEIGLPVLLAPESLGVLTISAPTA